MPRLIETPFTKNPRGARAVSATNASEEKKRLAQMSYGSKVETQDGNPIRNPYNYVQHLNATRKCSNEDLPCSLALTSGKLS